MQMILNLLNKAGTLRFLFASVKNVICHPAVLLYLCDLSKGKEIFGVKYDGTLCPSIRCLTSRHNVPNIKQDTVRHEGHIKLITVTMQLFLLGHTILKILKKWRETRSAKRTRQLYGATPPIFL